MPFVEVEGVSCYYAGRVSAGETTMVCCHGSGGGHHHWAWQLRVLAADMPVLAVDLPGHGRSGGEPSDSVEQYRDWLRAFSRALGLGPLVLVGHSLGGAIILDYALNYAEEVLALLIVGSGARLRVLPAFLDELAQGRVPLEMVEYLYGPETGEELLLKGKEEIFKTSPEIYLADLTACNRFDIIEGLGKINVPALAVCGSDDRLTPPKYSHYLAAQMPRCRAVIVPGAGHMIMLEKPNVLNEIMATFIEELAGASPGKAPGKKQGEEQKNGS